VHRLIWRGWEPAQAGAKGGAVTAADDRVVTGRARRGR
jgi:hypothetical protein